MQNFLLLISSNRGLYVAPFLRYGDLLVEKRELSPCITHLSVSALVRGDW